MRALLVALVLIGCSVETEPPSCGWVGDYSCQEGCHFSHEKELTIIPDVEACWIHTYTCGPEQKQVYDCQPHGKARSGFQGGQ